MNLKTSQKMVSKGFFKIFLTHTPLLCFVDTDHNSTELLVIRGSVCEMGLKQAPSEVPYLTQVELVDWL